MRTAPMTKPALRPLMVVGLMAAVTTAALGLPAAAAAAPSAITARFSSQTGTLTITGDASANTIVVACDANGSITVDAGAVPIRGGQATSSNVRLIHVRGAAGDDTVVLDDSSGSLPSAVVSGGDGDDSVRILGDTTAETFDASPVGSAVRVVRAGAAPTSMTLTSVEALALDTGGGDDMVTAAAAVARRLHLSVDGGAGRDSAVLSGTAGPDVFTVTPGVGETFVTVSANDYASVQAENVGIDMSGSGGPDGVADSVTVYGTDGVDAIRVDGGNGTVTVSGLAASVTVTNADAATDTLGISAAGGADAIDGRAVEPGAPRLALDGAAGNDTIDGGAGTDTIYGGAGNDLVSGGRGDDVIALGAGDDVYTAHVAEGSDTVDGGPGHDTQFFYGAEVAEQYGISASGDHVRFTRTLGTNATVNDLVGVERLVTSLSGGADSVDVADLTGTAVDDVDFDGRNSANAPDGAADTLTVHGTDGNDSIAVDSTGPAVHVTGLAYLVRFFDSDGLLDTLTVDGQGGDDAITAGHLVPGEIGFAGLGGTGNDVLVGTPAADVLRGDDGDDVLIGNGGNDVLDGGSGSNVIIP